MTNFIIRWLKTGYYWSLTTSEPDSAPLFNVRNIFALDLENDHCALECGYFLVPHST